MKSRKIFALMLTLCMVFATFVSVPVAKGASTDALTITVGSVNAEPGTEVTVPVSISYNTAGLCGLTLNFKYDDDVLKYRGSKKAEALFNMTLTKPGDSFTEGDLTFNWDDIYPDYSNGKILILVFDVASDAPGGDYKFDVNVLTACNFDLNDIDTTTVDGTVTVKAPHKHIYAGYINEDDTYHKSICSCGEVILNKHKWDMGVITTAPTTTTTGIKEYTCYMCKCTKEEIVPELITTFKVGTAVAEPTETVEIPVVLEINTDGICGMILNFQYDTDALAYQGAVKGKALPDMDLTMPGPEFTEGSLTFVWDHIEEDHSTGEILIMKFKVKEGTPEGIYPIGIAVKELFDFDYVDSDYHAISGKVFVNEPIHDHNYGEWQGIASIEGVRYHKKTCECGHEIKEKHTFEDVVTKEATCTTSGLMTRSCTVCGFTVEIPILKLDHTWSECAITVQPTKKTEGEWTYKCSVCGGTKKEVINKVLETDDVTNITVGNVTTRTGREITVPVSVSKNVGVLGLIMNLEFDTNVLTLTEATRGDAFGPLELSISDDKNSMPVVFLWDGVEADTKNGDIVLLKFSVSDTAEAGEYPISIKIVTAVDNDLNYAIVCGNSGSVKVIEYTPGDIDDDDGVGIKDLILIRQYIINSLREEIMEDAADVNKDGMIEIKDVVLMGRYIVGGYGIVLK